MLATVATITASALAQAPQAPQKDPGTTPSKDGSAAQKQTPEQPGSQGSSTLTPAKGADNKPAQQGAGNDQPVSPAQSPEQKPQK